MAEDLLRNLRHNSKYLAVKRTGLAVVLHSLLFSGLLVCLASQVFASSAAADTSTLTLSADDKAIAETKIGEAEAMRIVLRLGDRKVFLYEGETILNSYPVAVGAANTPTPQGEFEVSKLVIEPVWQSPWTGEIHPPGPNSALGLRWIGFFTDESGSFGFHGTPTLDSIGKAVSNGCVRMRNEDIVALFSQVSIGTPVVVVP